MVSIATQTHEDISHLYRFRDEARDTCSSHAVMMEMMDKIQSLEKDLEIAKRESVDFASRLEDFESIANSYTTNGESRELQEWCEEREEMESMLEDMEYDRDEARGDANDAIDERNNLSDVIRVVLWVWGIKDEFSVEGLGGFYGSASNEDGCGGPDEDQVDRFYFELKEREAVYEAHHEAELTPKEVLELKESLAELDDYMTGMTGVCDYDDVVDYIKTEVSDKVKLREENSKLARRLGRASEMIQEEFFRDWCSSDEESDDLREEIDAENYREEYQGVQRYEDK